MADSAVRSGRTDQIEHVDKNGIVQPDLIDQILSGGINELLTRIG